jgi:hypothetical protein
MTGLARLGLPFPQIAMGLGATSALLAGLLWVQGQRMHAAKVERDQLREQARRWKIDLETQQKSIETLKAAIQAKNEETERRFQQFQVASAQNARDVAAANARAEASRKNVLALREIINQPPDPRAALVPDSIITSLEGL